MCLGYKIHFKNWTILKRGRVRISTFPNGCEEAKLAKREFMARAEGECRNSFQ